MPSKALEQVTVHRRELHASIVQPHAKMKDGTDRPFNCQRAVARSKSLIHESIEELTDRLPAQQLATLWRVEGAEADWIMRSRRGHLDAATNDRRDKIIPAFA